MAYLDDVCLAGDYRVVSAALGRLTAAARQVGLRITPSKCELIPCGGADAAVDPRAFPQGVQINCSGSFTLLGASIGSVAFCEQHTLKERVTKAQPLLLALAELPDPQTALLLLRHCASYCKAWAQAALSTTHGGLGLHHASVHAPAGYAASVVATHGLCRLLDPTYNSAATTEAIQAFNHVLPASEHVPIPAPPTLRQQQLSEALDKIVIAKLAVPCPLCDGVADCFGVHAPCGGDRTKRHHALRAILAARAKAAGFHTDVEKPGLLPPRPEDGGAGEDGGSATNGRRPADVWVGNWGLLGPAAFDLAVTSGLRSGHLPSIAADGRRLTILALVAEACSGGWGPTALKTWKELSVALAVRNNEAASVERERSLQSLAVALQRENARAVLRRIE
ncbi:unnamed protein product [Durusdinium trenchii]|uniref:Reverse transcriptase domain-containing protein n=1 Tax=Durusdinium trenchii TaxID=1381693 RepID=A0ABP0SLX8_9DINO